MTWVRTTADREALYNLAAFNGVHAEHDQRSGNWVVLATAEGRTPMGLASVDSQEAADNIVRMLAEELGAIDLGRGIDF
jgi:hypothetical protein